MNKVDIADKTKEEGQIICGKVHKFGDNINTDFINPAQYMELSMEEMIAHAMEGADPDFSSKVQPGDIMVAGKNFGSGSSRETAPLVIKGSGISVLVAEFFARIFYRNAINIGLKVLVCVTASEIEAGAKLRIDPAAGTIEELSTGRRHVCTALPKHILTLVEDGGLLPHLEKRFGQK